MTVESFPLRGPMRFEALKSALRGVDTSAMTTPEVVDLCQSAAPGVTVDEMIAALRQVGDEHLRRAGIKETESA